MCKLPADTIVGASLVEVVGRYNYDDRTTTPGGITVFMGQELVWFSANSVAHFQSRVIFFITVLLLVVNFNVAVPRK